ncbi:hypothetical protein EYC59_02300 [Candidatus Saccharibacteria bacterium]|nr:MAG: hypothetical protein EYC59_02300 [Candidatus Saccharibacteria bacterium]
MHKLQEKAYSKRFLFIGAGLLIAAIGTYLLYQAHAANLVASFQVEAGTRSGNASVVSDSGASGGSAVKFAASTGTGRVYPIHTNIVSTMFWVGEAFQDTADGSQVCSAYDSEWQYSFFHMNTGTNNTQGCNGAPLGGCDAKLTNAGGKCSSPNATASLRTPANNYTPPAGSPTIYENPFYLDLPYDDYNSSGGGETTGYSRRCTDIPWANDPGYAGKCTNRSFSYMKNRWVKMWVGSKVCYGQIEDAGPADSGNGNGNYADYPYVFGTNDARPYNQSYGGAGADVSPALGSCLGMAFDDSITLSWQFVDDVDVPAGPWKTLVTTSPPN